MSLVLRPYQQRVVDDVISLLKQGKRRILIVVATGGGKTAIATELTKRCTKKGNSLFFICHRTELIDQTDATFRKSVIIPAYIQGGRPSDVTNKTQIASINTLVRRLDEYKPPKVVIWDEAHHIAAGLWSKVFESYDKAVHIGLTATPVRLDGKGLGDYFDSIVIGASTQWLIDNGYLVPFKYYAPSQINRKELKKSNGDYSKTALAKASFGSKIIGDNVEHYKKFAMGKRNLVFAMNVKHSKDIAERYNKEGIPVKHLDGTTPKDERKQAIKDFESGKLKVITNVDLFGEGYDLPAIEVVSLLRPTMSLALFLQWCGRGLRTCEEIDKKICTIFDHANNYEEHGFPNEDREWGLEAPKKRKNKENDALSIRRCPECFFAHRVSLKCPSCGFVYGSDGESIIEIAGELVIVGSSDYKTAKQKQFEDAKTFKEFARSEVCKALSMHKAVGWWRSKKGIDLKGSLDGYLEIERAYKYKNGWARIQWNRVNYKRSFTF